MLVIKDLFFTGVKLSFFTIIPVLLAKVAARDAVTNEFKKELALDKLHIKALETYIQKLEANQQLVSEINPHSILENTALVADYSSFTGFTMFVVCGFCSLLYLK